MKSYPGGIFFSATLQPFFVRVLIIAPVKDDLADFELFLNIHATVAVPENVGLIGGVSQSKSGKKSIHVYRLFVIRDPQPV